VGRLIDVRTLQFAEPLYLWLLMAPAALMAVWLWRFVRRRLEVRRFARRQVVPVRERPALAGDLAFWICLIPASALCIVALARPQAVTREIAGRSADLVVLQDGSASMYVADVAPDRWQRSMRFLRQLGEALTWPDDRVALALFAHHAAPQLRLTEDPNTLFFFLDHLRSRSPFPLEDDSTWDTNIEQGLDWGLKLVKKDEELYGRSRNARVFLVISDGQAWSGRVDAAIRGARQRRIPVLVAGVGTTTGGIVPEPEQLDGTRPPGTVRAVLDRESLQTIARAAGGTYYEIGREPDRQLANRIVTDVRRFVQGGSVEERHSDLYWRFLWCAAALMGLGTLALRNRAELWLQAAGLLVVVGMLARMLPGKF
jgi:Ca-activated chloride channel family protein